MICLRSPGCHDECENDQAVPEQGGHLFARAGHTPNASHVPGSVKGDVRTGSQDNGIQLLHGSEAHDMFLVRSDEIVSRNY